VLVENLGDQAHLLVHHDLGALADRDAGRLLPSMLQGVETEVGELGDLFVGGPNTEDSTGVLRRFIRRIKIVIQTAVRWQHCLSLACRGPPNPVATLRQCYRYEPKQPLDAPRHKSLLSLAKRKLISV